MEASQRGGLAEHRRTIAGLVLAGIVVLFAVLNLDEVEVNWIVGSGRSPLVLVIAVAFGLGVATGALASAVRRRRDD